MKRDRPLFGHSLVLIAISLTSVGFVLSTTQPDWLLGGLESTLQVGTAAPLVYVLLCVFAAPLHLSSVLLELAPIILSPGVALVLSFVGTLLGGLLTALIIVRLVGHTKPYRTSWPTWLQQLAAWLRRYPYQTGFMARLTLGSGAVLEAFFVFTGYTRRQYLVSAVLGTLIWTFHTLFAAQFVGQLLEMSPAIIVLVASLPLLLTLSQVLMRRARS